MKTYVQPGEVVPLIAPYDRLSGEGALVGALFGVATVNVLNTVEANFIITGVVVIKKTSAQAWTQGALIYWDNTAKEATTVSTSNTRIGAALLAAANPSATGTVRLNGIATPTGA